ncbi:hypothetical protein TWF281_008569 [Arthrobotrys megalospora]
MSSSPRATALDDTDLEVSLESVHLGEPGTRSHPHSSSSSWSGAPPPPPPPGPWELPSGPPHCLPGWATAGPPPPPPPPLPLLHRNDQWPVPPRPQPPRGFQYGCSWLGQYAAATTTPLSGLPPPPPPPPSMTAAFVIGPPPPPPAPTNWRELGRVLEFPPAPPPPAPPSSWSGPPPPPPPPPPPLLGRPSYPPFSITKKRLGESPSPWKDRFQPLPPPPPPFPEWDLRYRETKPKPVIKGSFNFLGLPREIRDEIYSYFLSRDPPPIVTPRIRRGYPTTYKQMALNLSLFRVNKQIHQEAAECFYGQNTFVIRVSTDIHKNKITVQYTAPWESITYSYTDSVALTAPLIESEYDGHYDSVPRDPSNQRLFVPHTYRHLFRNIRIDIEDLREERLFMLPLNMLTLRPSKKTSSAVLLPLLIRLRPLFDAAGKNLRVYVHVVSEMISGKIEARAHTQFHGTTAAMVTDGAQYTEFELLLRTFYEDMLRMVWPLTTGSWQYSITMPSILDVWTEEMKEAVLKDCDKDSELSEKEKGRFESFELGELSREYEWVIRQGRLLALNRYLYKMTGRGKRSAAILERVQHIRTGLSQFFGEGVLDMLPDRTPTFADYAESILGGTWDQQTP